MGIEQQLKDWEGATNVECVCWPKGYGLLKWHDGWV